MDGMSDVEALLMLTRAAAGGHRAMSNEDKIERMKFLLGEIARGRFDNGRPLAAEVSRQMARDVLLICDLSWSPRLPEERGRQS